MDKMRMSESNEPGCAEEICEGCLGMTLMLLGIAYVVLRLLAMAGF